MVVVHGAVHVGNCIWLHQHQGEVSTPPSCHTALTYHNVNKQVHLAINYNISMYTTYWGVESNYNKYNYYWN